MIIDARNLPDNHKIETDVCIIGAGTAGVTLAREFIGAGVDVCIFESGGLQPDQETQSLACGENVGHPYYSIDTAYARYFGGSTNRWMIRIAENDYGARMRPLDAIDFEKREWVPYSGWPFDKSHLDPFYSRAQKICNIEPNTFDVDFWENPKKTSRRIFAGDCVKTVIFKFGSRDPFLKKYLLEISEAVNIHTYLYANAIEIETQETAQTVNRVHLACLEGNKFSVSARIFILSVGGIETPRLLLLSNKVQTTGLCNQYDLVGRFFMEHLHFLSGVFIPSSPEVFTLTYLYNHVHKVHGVPIIGKLALEEQVLRQEKLVNYVVELVPRLLQYSSLSGIIFPSITSDGVSSYKAIRSAIRQGTLPDDFGKHLKNVSIGLNGIANNAFRKTKRKSWEIFNRKKIKAFRIASMSEQVPNPSSRITLSEKRDKLNLNCSKLDWRLDSMDIQSVIRSQKILKEALHKAGLGRLYIEFNEHTPPESVTGGWHQMGTTRMHTSPKKGVVDENCQVHGVTNLYIAGPSVFPTGGYANPALTTVALAVRLADHVKRLLS
jgi:choline dehydrogenase-like flavoprotein